MMKNKEVLTRLKKLNGQINGLISLQEKEVDCEKIFVQFQAAKAALEAAFANFLKSSFRECLEGEKKIDIETMMRLISKL